VLEVGIFVIIGARIGLLVVTIIDPIPKADRIELLYIN
jgi:hypothetical protein